MSFWVTPFEVSARSLSEPAQCRFVHILPGIATRHSDTMDCFFRVNGHRALVSVPCAVLNKLRDSEQAYLTDQQLAEIAGLFLRRTLEKGYDPTQAGAELPIGETELRTLAHELGYISGSAGR
jgi:hypothetical protein